MSFTYQPTMISPRTGTVVSAVRFIIADTIEDEAELQDEEINALHADTPTSETATMRVYLVSASAAHAVYRRYARMVDFSASGTSVQSSKRAETWRALADELTRFVAVNTGTGVLYAARSRF